MRAAAEMALGSPPGSAIASSTDSTRCAIWVSSSASMRRRWSDAGPAVARLTPPPKRRLSQPHECSAGASFRSWFSAGGETESAASARRTPWPIFSNVSLAPIFGVDLSALANKAQANRLDAHPRLRVVLHDVPMLGEPERGGGCDLRRRGGCAGAIHVDDVGAVDFGPGHVRRIGAERRLHLLVRPVVSLHGAEAKPGIGATVAHDAASRQHAAVTRRKHDAFGRGNAREIIACRGDHDDAIVIGNVDRIGQRA